METMKKIGYTTGVFDMFHVGHLNLIKRAKLECDYLIVGVSTDELVLEKKEKAPIIPFVERLAIVEHIEFVDEVVPQSNMNKIEAWENFRFDLMFVGDDWQGTEAWNAIENIFKSLPVEIIYLPYTKHTSSTKLRNILESLHGGE
jgi:glycerol-3-phosphate cytidylyltransferase